MTWLRAGIASAFTVTILLVLGVGVFVLWSSPADWSVDAIPVGADGVSNPGQSVGFGESSRTEPIVAPPPDTTGGEETGPLLVSLESDDGQWKEGQVSDTGPFIDADDDAGDYSFSPVLNIGEFLDADAD